MRRYIAEKIFTIVYVVLSLSVLTLFILDKMYRGELPDVYKYIFFFLIGLIAGLHLMHEAVKVLRKKVRIRKENS